LSAPPQDLRAPRFATLLAALVIAGCGGGDAPDAATGNTAEAQVAPTTGGTQPAPTTTSVVVPIKSAETPPGPGYFVDATNGNDSNPGTFALPWRSLSKLTGVSLKSGEGMYLRCGSIWRESLTLSSPQLVNGSIIAGYGPLCSTAKATITGATSLKGGWTTTGQIWYRTLPAGTPKITRLYLGQVAHRVARWPNFTSYNSDGALTDASSPTSNTALVVSSANRAPLVGRDLVGATVQLRSKPWAVESNKVASYNATSGAVTLTAATRFALAAGNSYVLQDKYWMIDTPGEFFHDTVANVLYVFPASTYAATDINTLAVEGSTRSVALRLSGRSSLIVSDIALTMSAGHGLQATDVPGIQINRIAATRNNASGVMLAIYDTTITSTLRSLIGNSQIGENWLNGIETVHMPRVDVANNTVTDSGVVDTSGPTHSAIAVGEASSVTSNSVQNAAFHGIVFSGTGGTTVKNNYVAGYCSRLSDCAGIYTWNGPKASRRTTNQSSLVEGNQLLGASANLYGAVGGGNDVVAGIYLDDFTLGSTLRSNWVASVPMGIFLHNASSNTVTQNRVWLTTKAALWASMDQTDADYMTGNIFSGNELLRVVQATGAYPGMPSISASHAIWFWHQLLGTSSLTSGSNLFQGNRHLEVNGVTIAAANVRSSGVEQQMTTTDWRAVNTTEGALATPLTFATSAPVLGAELVPGGGFTGSMGPWSSWFGSASPICRVPRVAAANVCSSPHAHAATCCSARPS
jgi:parallel beta-helix repeat protein